ncbi:PilC/PilY family type IV pilus protein [Methylobacillus sp.]|uniref:pilus assembly protein n=1 Tax=Methylobacillus sp. TaxID=56818 RepID=UPI0012C7F192|nr:PilC/PilY family type IV pilus protein [Methylobacillus sp.]MPS47614.1 pilus assembly protein [Methylobacillus sp.]
MIKNKLMFNQTRQQVRNTVFSGLLFFLFIPFACGETALADKPLFSGTTVTGNVALTLSVEFPTALGSAYTDAYSSNKTYVGYFDAEKCYNYNVGSTDTSRHFFEPVGMATRHVCSGAWSGNFLNWALTQTIDPMRYALTGGYRSIDEVGLTILEKAWASGQGGTVVDKNLSGYSVVRGATPYNWPNFNLRIRGLGNLFTYTNSGNLGGANNASQAAARPNIVPRSDSTGTNLYAGYARVRVCVPGMLESNCTAYGANYKPTGLIQKNATKLNFAAFGYLNDDDQKRDGGVLRAKMRQLGPLMSVPNAPDVVNPYPEWSDETGIFLKNPDVDAAIASGVTRSGVINYLNEFGNYGKRYKTHDPVSELYYTAVRYFKNQGNVSSYTSGLNSTMIDGFPVITDWDDPIKYSCQANFIIGVGDTNSWNDGNLPGSTRRINEPALPPEVSADTTVNVKEATDRVGNMQGISNLGNATTGRNNTFYIAGLAYDSHTRDIRHDFDGRQSITTYWLDVLESGFVSNNMYYLAAKYGGFDVPENFNPYSTAVVKLNKSQWDKNDDGDPDNYFRANNPQLMIENLGRAFDDILRKMDGASSTFSVAQSRVDDGDMSYGASYSTDGWVGSVTGSRISFDANGNPLLNKLWDASEKLELQTAGTGWDANRRIATSQCVVEDESLKTRKCTGVAFRLGSIGAADAIHLGPSTDERQSILNFLRGDRSNEGSAGTKSYRDRYRILADIVGSKVVPVGVPSAPFTDQFNPGYSAFKEARKSRPTIVYVGANDGMLHAFNGGAAGGNELFAYVPNVTFAGPTGEPSINGLAALAKPSYVHHYYVDATPVVADVNFGNAAGRSGGADWHSLLVGGLGKGGKAYYAIDVTNPESMINESAVAQAVKWEFTHQHLGYSYGLPLIVKTKKYGWVVVLTSGYNNDDGKGYFFFVDPRDGTLLETISTNEGSIGAEAGLAQASAFALDARDYTVDAIYAGDLLGNVWRLDVSAETGFYDAPTKLAKLVSPNGVPQPITTAPVIEVDANTRKRYVFVGTGKLLADSDIDNRQEQTFYAINDGLSVAFNTALSLPSGVSFPIVRDNLNPNNSGIDGIGSNPSQPMGWYVDLGFGSNGIAKRINTEMTSNAGTIAFAANLTGGDACSPAGSNELYAFLYGTGKSSLILPGGLITRTIAGSGLAADVMFYKRLGTNDLRIGVGSTTGDFKSSQTNSTGVVSYRQLNWRELPLSE